MVKFVVCIDPYMAASEFGYNFHTTDISPFDVYMVALYGLLASVIYFHVIEAYALLGQRDAVVSVPELVVSTQQYEYADQHYKNGRITDPQ